VKKDTRPYADQVPRWTEQAIGEAAIAIVVTHGTDDTYYPIFCMTEQEIQDAIDTASLPTWENYVETIRVQSPYPEHAKLAQWEHRHGRDARLLLGEFFTHLTTAYELCEFDAEEAGFNDGCPWKPVRLDPAEALADFIGINYQAFQDEKHQMLLEIRRKQAEWDAQSGRTP
jgi:hypothetical protein